MGRREKSTVPEDASTELRSVGVFGDVGALGTGPGQRFVDAADLLFDHLGNHVVQVGVETEYIELGRLDRRADRRSRSASEIRSGEPPVFPPLHDSPENPIQRHSSTGRLQNLYNGRSRRATT